MKKIYAGGSLWAVKSGGVKNEDEKSSLNK